MSGDLSLRKGVEAEIASVLQDAMFMTSMRETTPGDDIVVQQVQHA